MKREGVLTAPSSILLKFLKAQSEGICFFSANQSHGFSASSSSVAKESISRLTIKTRIATPRHTTKARYSNDTSHLGTPLNAGYTNFGNIWSCTNHISANSARNQRVYSRSSAQSSYGSKRSVSQGWLRRIFWKERQQKQRPLLPDDLPQGLSKTTEDTNPMLNMTRSIAAKAGSELKLRCTELDENGNVVTVNGEFKKSELIAKVRLLTWIYKIFCYLTIA